MNLLNEIGKQTVWGNSGPSPLHPLDGKKLGSSGLQKSFFTAKLGTTAWHKTVCPPFFPVDYFLEYFFLNQQDKQHKIYYQLHQLSS